MRVRPAMKRESCSRFGGAGAPAPTRDGGQRSHARSIRGYQGGLRLVDLLHPDQPRTDSSLPGGQGIVSRQIDSHSGTS
jgi:hypothetical protein